MANESVVKKERKILLTSQSNLHKRVEDRACLFDEKKA